MDILNALERYAGRPAVSGAETSFRHLLQEDLSATGLRLEFRGHSLVVFPEHPDPDAPLLLTHLDEPGLVISSVEDRGFLRFRSVGEIAGADLANQEVLVGPRELPGVIGLRPPHILSEKERHEGVQPQELFIDLGMEDARDLVRVGDCAVVRRRAYAVGTTRYLGRALGDKAGVAALATLVQRRGKALRCPVAFCAGHHAGFRGAAEVAEALAPRRAVVVDALPARSFQDPSPLLELGKGPGLVTGPLVDRSFTAELEARGADARILLRRLPLAERRVTDAWTVQIAAGGVALGLLALPVRYPGSFGELVDLEDLRRIFLLLEALDCGKGAESCCCRN